MFEWSIEEENIVSIALQRFEKDIEITALTPRRMKIIEEH